MQNTFKACKHCTGVGCQNIEVFHYTRPLEMWSDADNQPAMTTLVVILRWFSYLSASNGII